MRKALVVGIDHYEYASSLFGCVNDAIAVADVLRTHQNGKPNFGVKCLTGTGSSKKITRSTLKDTIEELFCDDSDIALFYFSGHGHIEAVGGYILASDSERGDEGVSLSDILTFANESKAKNKIIALDSCYSGYLGYTAGIGNDVTLSKGLSILTASTESQYASEENGFGLFTGLFVNALQGAACNLVGEITPGSIYAHIDQSLGEWDQRPVFKTYVESFVSLRTVKPPIDPAELRRLPEFFPTVGHNYPLDPSYEPRDEGRTPDMPAADLENTRIFAILQRYNRLGLLVPVDADHMWNAAMESKSCKLTALGEHYRKLALRNRI